MALALAGLLRTRRSQHRLDALLAARRSPWSTPELTRRAGVLVSRPERERIARAIVGLVRIAELRAPSSPYLRVRHGAVLERRDALLALAARLCAAEPVDVAVIAQLSLLVFDRAGPGYEGGTPESGVAAVVDRCTRIVGGDFCAPL